MSDVTEKKITRPNRLSFQQKHLAVEYAKANRASLEGKGYVAASTVISQALNFPFPVNDGAMRDVEEFCGYLIATPETLEKRAAVASRAEFCQLQADIRALAESHRVLWLNLHGDSEPCIHPNIIAIINRKDSTT